MSTVDDIVKSVVSKAKAEVNHSELRTGEYAEHYGVKGQRWGFRKATTRGGTPPSKRKAKPDKGEEKEAPKKKTVKGLSDSELNERIRRLQAEKQYSQLTAPEKSKNVVADILANSGKQIASQVITQVGTAYLKKAIGVQLDKRLPAAYAVGKVLNEVKKD